MRGTQIVGSVYRRKTLAQKISVARVSLCVMLTIPALLVAFPSSAFAAQGVASFFGGWGTQGGQFILDTGIAINQNGVGGADAGDIYIADQRNNRVEQLSASGSFIRAFGLGVAGPGVNICTVAASCTAGEAKGTAAALVAPSHVAIDQTTGTVYVTGGHQNVDGHITPSDNRVAVFSAAGEFEGAFGWNVKASGGAEELQYCTSATGCKAGSSGAGAGQFDDGAGNEAFDSVAVSPVDGHVIVGNAGNQRVDEFAPTFESGKVTGVSFVHGFGWGANTGANEFQICTIACHAPAQSSGTGLGQFNENSPRGVAVDESGRIYVLSHDEPGPKARITTFNPEGQPIGVFTQGDLVGVTVNASNNHVLTTERRASSAIVAEYDSDGNTLQTFLDGDEANGLYDLAQREATGSIYIATLMPPQASELPEWGVIELGESVPPTASVEPVSTFTGTTAVFEGHVNPRGLFTRYHFEYSSDGAQWVALRQAFLPSDNLEHAVVQEATGLEALTHYQVRLVADKLFNSGTAVAETNFETSTAPPITSNPTVSAVSDQGASLSGTVNPEQQTTTYRFECVSDLNFNESGYREAAEIPPGGATLSPAGKEVSVNQSIHGLGAATTYHCRLKAENPTGTVTGPETTFTTYAVQSPGLPDGRVFEQATPVMKNGSDAKGWEYLIKGAPDGNAVTYFITGGGGNSGGGGQEFPTYVANRVSEGWASHPFLPSSAYGERANVVGWSEDLNRDYVLTWNSGGSATFYSQDVAGGTLEEIASGLEPYEGAQYAGESRDGNRVLFESRKALVPEAIEGAWNLYVWNRDSDSLSLVSVLPDESISPGGAFAGPYNWGALEAKAGGAGGNMYTSDLHVFSDDGSKVFFTTSNVDQLYVRTGIGSPDPSTAQVSASHKTNGSGPGGRDPNGSRKAAFMEATPDAHYAFFTSPEELTNDATTGTADQGNDLYRYDVETGQLIDLASDSGDQNGAEVQGLLGASADGSYAYFAANGVLAEGATVGDCKASPVTGWAQPGTCNLYLWHEGTISFVSRIGGDVGTGGRNWVSTIYNGQLRPMKSARVSEDGKTVSFLTSVSPTSYDSEGKSEFYRYNTEEGLRCVSCNPTGAPPLSGATLQDVSAGFTAPNHPSPFFIRNLSVDGKRVFFETPDKLIASDTNGDAGCPAVVGRPSIRICQDVYEWEASGAGTCQSKSQNGGCLYLISTGESSEPSYFADASTDGNDVFLFTRQTLVRQDTDQLYDVYDARIGGGIASQNQPSPTPCEGEACKPTPSAPPDIPTAVSASFSGPGNLTSVRRHSKKHHRSKHHRSKRHEKKSKASRKGRGR